MTINAAKLEEFVDSLAKDFQNGKQFSVTDWDSEGMHFRDKADPDLTIQYLLVVDALNYCFWPNRNLEYHNLAISLRDVILQDRSAFSAENLMSLKPETLQSWFDKTDKTTFQLPLLEERCRLLNEVGECLHTKFGGLASNLVKSAQKSAANLVNLITSNFGGFRDHCVYKGHQTFFYKRAQIFVADVWGAFAGEGIGEFNDVDLLTMFADYRVPQILRHLDVLQYTDALAEKVDRRDQLASGSEEESEIRAATVQVVEQAIQLLNTRHGLKMRSIELDWLLWQRGEAICNEIKPHHCTLTIYY